MATICLCVKAKYDFEHSAVKADLEGSGTEDIPDRSKDIFFFADGSVIFWSVPELERKSVLDFLRKNPDIEEADGCYDEDIIYDESEMMTYSYIKSGSSNVTNSISTHLNTREDYQICLKQSKPRNLNLETYLEKYAFSNAMSSSVKLGAIEAHLDRFIDSIEFLSEDMKRGRPVNMSRNDILMKTGEVFALRHVLNLSSDLLDTPDFYWDRENLELLYHATCAHLSVGKRIRVTNEKINHCCELLDLVTNHLNDKHSSKLEWYIIILIMIEVLFEVFHFAHRFMV